MAKRKRGGKKAKQSQPEYTIARILNSRINDRDHGFDYPVRWQDYDESHDSWEPWEFVSDTAAYEVFRETHFGDSKHHFPPPSADREKPARQPKGEEIGNAGAEEESEPNGPRRRFPPAAVPEPSLDIRSFPHILSLIISHSSRPALTLFARCSKQLFHLAIPHLYRNLRMSSRQLEQLIETGIVVSPDKLANSRRTQRFLTGRSYSTTLHEALQHVRSLTLLEHDNIAGFPALPRGCFGDLDTLVAHLTPGWYPPDTPNFRYGSPLYIPPRINRRTIGRLVVRVPDGCVKLSEPVFRQHFFDNGSMPDDVTLIFPKAGILRSPPTCEFAHHRHLNLNRTVPVVLLPTSTSSQEPGSWVPSKDVFWQNLPERLSADLLEHNIRLVGAEYLGISQDELLLSLQPTPLNHTLTLLSFGKWLDDQAPGSIFTAEEELGLRAADRELLSWTERRRELANEIPPQGLAAVPNGVIVEIPDSGMDTSALDIGGS